MASLLLSDARQLRSRKGEKHEGFKDDPGIVVSFALGLTAYPAMAKQDHKSKIKSTETKPIKDNSGREGGALPSGLQKYTERKGELPSGLQKKKDDGELTKGLQDGGKKVKTTKTK